MTTLTRLTVKPGDIVIDTSCVPSPRYAVGKTGFLGLETGDFLPYDSAFPGPSYFERPEFVIEGTVSTASRVNTLADAGDAIEQVDYQFHLLAEAKTLGAQSEAFIGLSNAVSDLRSWHPAHDGDSDTLPWERQDDEFNG